MVYSDIRRRVFQILFAPEDWEKTSFSTHQGIFQFSVMSFGLRNALDMFQRFMDTVLGDALRK